MRAAFLALLAAALLALAPGAAHADDPPPQVALRLTYNLGPGAKNCPPEQALHDEVARRMGYDPFTPDAPEHIVASLNRSGSLFSGTLELFDSSGKSKWKTSYAFRGKKDEDCAALDMAMAIDIAVEFIHFSLPSSAAAPSPPPSPEAPTPAEAPVSPPQPPAHAQPGPPAEQASLPPPPASPPTRSSPSHRPQIELGGSSFVAGGIAPGVTIGGALHAGLHWPSIPLSLSAEVHLAGSIPGAVDASPDVQVETFQVGAAAVPCWRPLFLLLCGVATGSEVYAWSAKITHPKSARNATFRAGARVGLEASLRDQIRLRLYGELLGTIKPARANIAGEHAWSTSPVSGGGGLTIVHFF